MGRLLTVDKLLMLLDFEARKTQPLIVTGFLTLLLTHRSCTKVGGAGVSN